jgi:hypothetical protein
MPHDAKWAKLDASNIGIQKNTIASFSYRKTYNNVSKEQ